MHSNLLVNSKPKNMLLMIRNGDRPSQSLRAETRGLDSKSDSFPVTVTHGLKRGCRGSRQTNIERITIPSSTNHSHERRTGPFIKKRQVCTTGIPCGSILVTRRVVSCRILQSPGKSPNTSLLPENTPVIEQSDEWSSDQVQWISNFHESITRGRRNESGTLSQ